jgi:hypothetical protein
VSVLAAALSAAGPLTRRPSPHERQERILAAVMASITRKKNLNPKRRGRTYPPSSSEPATTPTGENPATTAPATPATTKLANLHHLGLAA